MKNLNVKPDTLTIFVLVYITYISIHGIISIFMDNIFFSSIKDIVLVILSLLGLYYVLLRLRLKSMTTLFFLLLGLFCTGTLGVLISGDWLSWVYGMKITFLPILILFLGVLLGRYESKVTNLLFYIYILSLVVWTIQYYLGIEKLMDIGYIYGVNIKTFTESLPRLPSIFGAPDNYAFTLALLGLIIEKSNICRKSKKILFFVKIFTLSFLILSTVRNAVLFWIVSQSILAILKIYNIKIKTAYNILAVKMFTVCLGLIISFYYFFYSNIKIDLLNYNSILIRIDHWGSYLPSIFSINGLVGNGIGSVGAASRRVSDLGFLSSNYAVDNQYLAIFAQTGLLGSLFFLMITIYIIYMIIHTNRIDSQYTVALLFGTSVASLFSTILEIFPFNVIFWLYLGMTLFPKNK
ncbi:hypothetical protein M0L17_01660 [Bacillaceae bacterium OS4b]|nr:hypothetical protein [Bacillaceae bacterium OS4b]